MRRFIESASRVCLPATFNQGDPEPAFHQSVIVDGQVCIAGRDQGRLDLKREEGLVSGVGRGEKVVKGSPTLNNRLLSKHNLNKSLNLLSFPLQNKQISLLFEVDLLAWCQ